MLRGVEKDNIRKSNNVKKITLLYKGAVKKQIKVIKEKIRL